MNSSYRDARSSSLQRMVRRYGLEVNAPSLAAKKTVQVRRERGIHRVKRLGEAGWCVLVGGEFQRDVRWSEAGAGCWAVQERCSAKEWRRKALVGGSAGMET